MAVLIDLTRKMWQAKPAKAEEVPAATGGGTRIPGFQDMPGGMFAYQGVKLTLYFVRLQDYAIILSPFNPKQ